MYTSTAKVYPYSTYHVQLDYETSTAANIFDIYLLGLYFFQDKRLLIPMFSLAKKDLYVHPCLQILSYNGYYKRRGGNDQASPFISASVVQTMFFFLNNMVIRDTLHLIYPRDLEIKDTSITSKFAPVDTIGRLYTKLNDNCVHFSFQIRNFPYMSSYITYISSVWCIHIIADPLLQSL